jgi:hypothetical protein
LLIAIGIGLALTVTMCGSILLLVRPLAPSSWLLWQQFRLVVTCPPPTENIFGLGEYLASLALFLVVMTISDFRYTYRLSLTRTNLRKAGFWISLGIGIAILVTDVWFDNCWPVPKLVSNPNNVKALFGLVFLSFVFRVISVAVIRPPVFTKGNARPFFEVNYHLIHQGNPDRLQVVAEELRRSIPDIVALAATVPKLDDAGGRENLTDEQAYAHDFLLLIGDRRFCRVVVDKVAAFAFACFVEAQKHTASGIPIFQFARNIGQEFIRNTDSAFYQEESGYYSGFVGYTRPTTKIVFGSFEFIEKCATDGDSPIDTDYREFHDFSATQMEGYARASLTFVESCLQVTKGRWYPHSYALARTLSSFADALSGVSEIDGMERFNNAAGYGRLRVVVDFVNHAITLVDKHAASPKSFRISRAIRADIYDDLAQLMFKTIHEASYVSSPEWTSWSIQHNAVWSEYFGLECSAARKVIALKVRRLLYSEIKRMDRFANFKGARILGYCLHVLGLKLTDRHSGSEKEFYPLQAAVLRWTQANYKRLVADHPRVAEACLHGNVSYDSDNHRLVQTLAAATEKEPRHQFLDLD